MSLILPHSRFYTPNAALYAAAASAAWSPLDPSTPAVIWLDPSDLSSMWKERSGASATTPAAVDDVVGTTLNKGSAGGYAVAATDAARPILRQSGALYYLEFDGTDDLLTLPVGTIGSVATLGIAMRDTAGSDGTFRTIAGIGHASTNDLTSSGCWMLGTGESGSADKVGIYRQTGTAAAKLTHTRGVDVVYIAKQPTSSTFSMQKNGDTPVTGSGGNTGIGSASNNPFRVGKAPTANAVPYRMYGVAMVAADWTGDDLNAFRTYLGSKSGQSL